MINGFLFEGMEWKLYSAEGCIFWFPADVVMGKLELLSNEEISDLSYLPYSKLREKMSRGFYDGCYLPTNNMVFEYIQNFGRGEW